MCKFSCILILARSMLMYVAVETKSLSKAKDWKSIYKLIIFVFVCVLCILPAFSINMHMFRLLPPSRFHHHHYLLRCCELIFHRHFLNSRRTRICKSNIVCKLYTASAKYMRISLRHPYSLFVLAYMHVCVHVLMRVSSCVCLHQTH